MPVWVGRARQRSSRRVDGRSNRIAPSRGSWASRAAGRGLSRRRMPDTRGRCNWGEELAGPEATRRERAPRASSDFLIVLAVLAGAMSSSPASAASLEEMRARTAEIAGATPGLVVERDRRGGRGAYVDGRRPDVPRPALHAGAAHGREAAGDPAMAGAAQRAPAGHDEDHLRRGRAEMRRPLHHGFRGRQSGAWHRQARAPPASISGSASPTPIRASSTGRQHRPRRTGRPAGRPDRQ